MSKFSDFFYLSKNDRTVAFWLLGLIILIALFIHLGDRDSTDPRLHEKDSVSWDNQNYRSQRRYDSSGKNFSGRNYGDSYATAVRKPNLRPFDLNSATPEELSDIGFSERQIASVMKYRSKGGIYRRPEQMSRISGMTKGQYDALLPYFTVADEFKPASEFVTLPERRNSEDFKAGTENAKAGSEGENAKIGTNGEAQEYPQKLRPGETIPLNAADTTLLVKVPGIGIARAKQIIKYRERLGGFHSIEQLNDMQNIPAEAHDYFTLDKIQLKKIHINHLTINRLISHPYITFFQAQTIYNYRQQKGPIHSLQDLSYDKNFPQEKSNASNPTSITSRIHILPQRIIQINGFRQSIIDNRNSQWRSPASRGVEANGTKNQRPQGLVVSGPYHFKISKNKVY